jgi:hypothetical protein
MNDDLTEKALVELQECWPYQQIPETHLRHWRDVFRSFSREIVKRVLHDCSITMTGRPGFGEFGKLCHELSMVEAKKARRGPYLHELPGNCPPTEAIPSLVDELRGHLKVKP